MEILTFQTGELQTSTYLLIDGSSALVIDPGADCPALDRAIAERGLSLETVLLTHTHFDHMLGVPALLAKTGAKLVVPAADCAGLTDGTRNLTTLWGMGTLPPLAADRTVAEGAEVTVGETVLRTLSTPGHTSGSSCYLVGDTLFSGDTMFDGGYGRTDLPGGDWSALLASLKRLCKLPRPLHVYPGHGAPFVWR